MGQNHLVRDWAAVEKERGFDPQEMVCVGFFITKIGRKLGIVGDHLKPLVFWDSYYQPTTIHIILCIYIYVLYMYPPSNPQVT